MNILQDDYDKAMNVIKELALDYENELKQDLITLLQLYQKSKTLLKSKRAQCMREYIFRIAHDMKGRAKGLGFIG